MAGFPKEGKLIEIGHDPEQLAGPVSLSSCFVQQPGPGPQQVQRQIQRLSGKPKRPGGNLHAICARSIEAKNKNRDTPSQLCLGSLVSCPHLDAGVAGAAYATIVFQLVLLFASFLAIPLAR
jgi:hypothetical protein